MDFKSFQNHRQTQKGQEQPTQEDIKKTAERFEGKSDAELLGEIARTAKKERAEGTYSDEKLDQFVSSVSPMLTAEQRARLEKAIRMIKGD